MGVRVGGRVRARVRFAPLLPREVATHLVRVRVKATLRLRLRVGDRPFRVGVGVRMSGFEFGLGCQG